jgi:hypothetical protein
MSGSHARQCLPPRVIKELGGCKYRHNAALEEGGTVSPHQGERSKASEALSVGRNRKGLSPGRGDTAYVVKP